MMKSFEGPLGTTNEYTDIQQGGFWKEVFKNDGEEQITLAGMSFTTVRIVKRREGLMGNSYKAETTYWLDRRTGMLVKLDHQHINGRQAGVQPFQLVRLLEPGA
ncbi:hypothetical protein EBE87_23105 [Pseudoroseomonas wenyumeiae]|uniref:Uncharacterized protein n=2 Tax=Teichococcus wenyumeiae TaxID=2478470 RepID=A0A3A9JEK8_9PROT|nr:hypothetical protein D6Z83_08205 [Pseudoroseomonas wenyumeiae]RMI17317.1 hypothetical protein EBE87_23105 [Pseudoroseomonas wenyumeiae]